VLSDSRYQVFQGSTALVNVVLGKGAFKVADDYRATPDIFNVAKGQEKF